MDNLQDLIKKLTKEVGAEKMEGKLEELLKKAPIADRVCAVLGEEVRKVVSSNCEHCNKNWREMMALLCCLMDEGKIILREEKKDD